MDGEHRWPCVRVCLAKCIYPFGIFDRFESRTRVEMDQMAGGVVVGGRYDREKGERGMENFNIGDV